MKKLRVGVFGAGGKMGQEVTGLLKGSEFLDAAVGVSLAQKAVGYRNVSDVLMDAMSNETDVWIDFSLPGGFDQIVDFCIKWKKPLISGTTGLSEIQHQKIKDAGKIIPILWSSNMSLGIVALKKAMEAFAILNNFDFQIEEIHHKMKLDKPSGTAVTLQGQLQKIVGRREPPRLYQCVGAEFLESIRSGLFHRKRSYVLSTKHSRGVFLREGLFGQLKIFRPGNQVSILLRS
ncbi:MAG: 4-hydroxy-tetrahydrodipicolinate reductase [Bdellovibrionales bacterium]|nr:4-hydroxy-tetrahydrodipicolinate reductase [Bdellovibrionales bacterium]